MKKIFYVLLFVALLIAACLPSQEQIDQMVNSAQQTALAQITVVPAATQDVNLIVQATFQALTLTAQAPQQNVPNGSTGSISGNLSYPSEGILPQLVVAFDVNSSAYYYVTTAENQSTYQIDNLPPGNYYVVAYLQDGSLRAGYSYAVPCGLSVDCTDNSLIPVTVISGQTTNDINPQDWYAPEGSFPDSPLP